MSKPKALVVGIHHWASPVKVGTHYIVEYLLRFGFEVAYISAPITPLHRLLPDSKELLRRRQNHSVCGEYAHNDMLWHYVPGALVAPDARPILSSSCVLNNWQRTSIPNLAKTVHSKGFGEVDILFVDTIYQLFWLKTIAYRASAYRLADNTSGFKGYSKAAGRVESRLLRSVDQVFTASSRLVNYAVARGGVKATPLMNGVDIARFSNREICDIELLGVRGPIAIYVGVMSYWFDHDVIVALANARPDMTILLIGPTDYSDLRYQALPNVRLIGPIGPESVPAYLNLADVGLIPFRVDSFPDLINDVNPLKLYEYMAAGLPVVASRWPELELLASPARLANDLDDFVRQVCSVVDAKGGDSEEREFARGFDWHLTLRPLGVWLDEVLDSKVDYHHFDESGLRPDT